MKRTLSLVSVVLVALAQTAASQEAVALRLAIELGADRDPAPIPLGPGGSIAHGVAYDRFTQAHLASRVAARRGAPLNPLKPPAILYYSQLIIVAGPLSCGDRMVNPTDVEIFNKATPVSKYQPARGAGLQKLLPGAQLPADVIGVMFSQPALRAGQFVRVSYAGPACDGTSKQVMLTVSATEPRGLERPAVEMAPDQPAPSGPITLNISGVVDLDGRLRYASAPEAKTPFGAAALEAARKMKFDPARINGAPVPWTAGVILTFAAPAANTSAGTTTPNVPGLTAASSKCQIASGDTYGFFSVNPIRIGGGPDGANRAKRFMSILRGPEGQGLTFENVGPVLRRGQTDPLEAFEITYAGLAQPVRIYFDPAKEDALVAPKGFTCAAPIVVK